MTARDRLAALLDSMAAGDEPVKLALAFPDGGISRTINGESVAAGLADYLLADPRTLLAAALETDEGEAALAEALRGWWAAPEGSMPGTTEWTNAGGWLGDARLLAAELAKETPA